MSILSNLSAIPANAYAVFYGSLDGETKPQRGNLMFKGLILFLLALATQANAYDLSEQKSVSLKPAYFFYTDLMLKGEGLHEKGEAIAQQMAFDIATKTHTTIEGGFTYVFEDINVQDVKAKQQVQAKLGWKVRSALKKVPLNKYAFETLPESTYYRALFEGDNKEVPQAWQSLYEEAKSAGFKPNGNARMQIKLSSNTGYIVSEMLLGVE